MLKEILTKVKEQWPKIKAIIPNALTLSRLVMAPAIPFVFSGKNPWVIMPTVIAVLFTDFLDGKLARRWGVVSDFGKTWDPICDKGFGISALGSMIAFINPLMWGPLIMECVISLVSVINRLITGDENISKTAEIGRAKMWLLGITMGVTILTLFNPDIINVAYPLCGLTLAAQGTTAYVYAKRLFKKESIQEEEIVKTVEDDENAKEKIISKNKRISIIDYWKKAKEETIKLKNKFITEYLELSQPINNKEKQKIYIK